MLNNDEAEKLIEALRTLLSNRVGFYRRDFRTRVIKNETYVFGYSIDRRRKCDHADKIRTHTSVTRYYPFEYGKGGSYLCVEILTNLNHPYGELRHGYTITSEGDFKMLEEILSQHDAFWEFTSSKYSIE
jgi:hypothetical protein